MSGDRLLGFIDASDEAADLPPLADVDAQRVLTVLAWDLSAEGLLMLEDAAGRAVSEQTPHVAYLSVRGWSTDPAPGETSKWHQLHLAISVADLEDLGVALVDRAAELGG